MKYFLYSAMICLGLILVTTTYSCQQEPKEEAVQPDSSSIFAINHIGLTVRNLDRMLAFYQGVCGFKVLSRQVIGSDIVSAKLLGINDVSFKKVVLQAPNMLFELTEFRPLRDSIIDNMPPEGPGMTHTCFQSPSWDSGYDKFIKNGIQPLSKGDHPIDLGGSGITYAYAHDPEGNMIEMEQLDQPVLAKNGRDSALLARHPLWMTQVALLSPDVDRLAGFYEKLLGKPASRKGAYKDNLKLDSIANRDQLELKAIWINMDGPAKMMELMQYIKPKTGATKAQQPTDLGYHFSYETTDIQGEYLRMKEMGVDLISEPQDMGKYWAFYARDIDGNLFALRQIKEADSPYSVKNFLFSQS
ncbi:MAG: VOC family protein [Saprospiraceae bacterium]|nr:VOC family protein [Saprospiraceae bacterium]